MQNRVAHYIANQQLLQPTDSVIVALSGGADSVALLQLLLRLGYQCTAAHCNFHLRGAESDRDEQFVRTLCTSLHIPLEVTHFNTRRTATQRGISIEMAARDLRYQWFEEVRLRLHATAVATAHHRDDSVETFLLNLLRGTGIDGLQGIRPRMGKIVRPLLCLSRAEILTYLQTINQPYVTDSTNLTDDFHRNKIRLRLLPLMEEINPSATSSILSTAEHLASAATLYHRAASEAIARVSTRQGDALLIDIAALQLEAAPSAILFELLHPLGFTSSQLSDILQSLTAQPGRLFLSDTWRLLRDRTHFIVQPLPAPRPDTSSEAPLLLDDYISFTTHPLTPDFTIPRTPDTACFDADALSGKQLTIRLWQPGDWFIPFGMKGRKLISDYLTDCKLNRFERECQPVLCAGTDIIWVVGRRSDNRYRVTPATTRIVVAQQKSLPNP